jgi:GntR family transcriptional regulator
LTTPGCWCISGLRHPRHNQRAGPTIVFSISASDPRPIYIQIMDEVRRAIAVGTLGSDEPLPSVRQLAGELRVNPNTVQQAYRELERTGAVYVRRGQGTYVSNSGNAERERRLLVREVAVRALRDAHRHGCTADELIAMLRSEVASPAAYDGEPHDAEPHGAESDGAESDGAESEDAESEDAESEDAESEDAAADEPSGKAEAR